MFGITDGFDIVIGNPPYVRIQTLKQQNAAYAEFLKAHYEAASKGNFDLYVVFVERGMQLLSSKGNLAYILPHKFFNAQYGQPLRALLAEGNHLAHIVHFGDEQVFPGSTNYVCLLFLRRAGTESFRFVKVDNLLNWLETTQGAEAPIPAKKATEAEWNFAVGKGAWLFEKLSQMPEKLGNVADVFVGLQTSADDVFILDFVEDSKHEYKLKSKSLGEAVFLEKALLFPLASGTDVGSFAPLPNRQYILFPYTVEHETANLIPFRELSKRWPKTAKYLEENKARLEQREGGKFKDAQWHRFGRNQNLGIQGRKKLCAPRLVESLHAAYDSEGTHFLDNVDVGGIV